MDDSSANFMQPRVESSLSKESTSRVGIIWGHLELVVKDRERSQRTNLVKEKTGKAISIVTMKLFDAHCHLQDPRIISKAPQVIKTALEAGVVRFAVNGVSEEDWHLVKEMGETYPSVIPCFGLHPWFVAKRSPDWFETLKEFFDATPSAAVGEIGVDKGPLGPRVDFSEQIEVFQQQLELAKELKKPASVHCVDAFDDLLDLMRSMGPFPAGIILHSYMGSAEIVPELSELGSYFSFSGHNMSQDAKKFKKVLKTVPCDRILLETDSPDALPKSVINSPLGTLNQPANIHYVLDYVASLLEVSKEELAKLTYKNAVRLFSYKGSKVHLRKQTN